MSGILLTLQQTSSPGTLWIWAVTFVLVLAALLLVIFVALRRHFRQSKGGEAGEIAPSNPRVNDPAAFMTASMQAVIQRLREQEKELESLHLREKERAQQTERLSEAVTRHMPAGLLIVNAAGVVISANPAAEAALGIQSLSYRRASEMFGADAPLTALLNACLEHFDTFRREELAYTTPAGQPRQLGVTISPILSTAGKASGALCLLSDLTELKVLQQQMQLKESLASLGVLAAGIAHEFKNSLATISGYAQMIRNEAKDGDSVENAAKIVDQTRALTHVVTEFLKFARPLDLADEDVVLHELIDRVAEEVLHAVPQVEIVINGEFAEVKGDESLLRQALLNLTRNAAEAATANGSGGSVTIHGVIERHPGGQQQRVSIHDSGAGVPAEDLPKIFLPFYTTKAQGTGLGLAIVQKIVIQHGGRVEARNAPGGGAEFILWLPIRTLTGSTVDSASASA